MTHCRHCHHPIAYAYGGQRRYHVACFAARDRQRQRARYGAAKAVTAARETARIDAQLVRLAAQQRAVWKAANL